MANKSATPTELAPLTASELSATLDPNSFDSVLAEYGITSNEMYVPTPPTVVTAGFDDLAEFDTEVFDTRGNKLEDVIAHTGPLMFLGKSAERDSDKFSTGGYDGYYQYAVLSPRKGKTLVSLSRPADAESKPAVIAYMDTLKSGAWFQVGVFKTSNGFRVFNPIPVQR